ncbi:hypothetical protein ACKI1S_16750 [Streptomyces galilaeus]|uniref:Uncharacterized protein n=1 Tax=Streptomyces galilaeus TaxID=33899 RepID=A0ABW9IH16_STRGJ
MDPGDAAVWAALIGVGGALLGTFGGHFTGKRASREGARVQGQLQFNEWLRDQQRTAYAELHARAVDTLQVGHRFAHVGGSDAQEALDASIYRLVQAGATVQMLGPERMKDLAEAITTRAYKVPGRSPDSERTWELWTAGLTMELAGFSDEASKILSNLPALK